MGASQDDQATTAGIAAPPITIDVCDTPPTGVAEAINKGLESAKPIVENLNAALADKPVAPPEYVLRVDIKLDPAKAIDDAAAQSVAKSFLDTLSNVPAIGVFGHTVKLQQIYSDKPPRKVDL